MPTWLSNQYFSKEDVWIKSNKIIQAFSRTKAFQWDQIPAFVQENQWHLVNRLKSLQQLFSLYRLDLAVKIKGYDHKQTKEKHIASLVHDKLGKIWITHFSPAEANVRRKKGFTKYKKVLSNATNFNVCFEHWKISRTAPFYDNATMSIIYTVLLKHA